MSGFVMHERKHPEDSLPPGGRCRRYNLKVAVEPLEAADLRRQGDLPLQAGLLRVSSAALSLGDGETLRLLRRCRRRRIIAASAGDHTERDADSRCGEAQSAVPDAFCK